MTHIFKPQADTLETRIRRDDGVKIIVRLGGKKALMRFFLKRRGQADYRLIPYRDGLNKVTIPELAEIQREFLSWKALK